MCNSTPSTPPTARKSLPQRQKKLIPKENGFLRLLVNVFSGRLLAKDLIMTFTKFSFGLLGCFVLTGCSTQSSDTSAGATNNKNLEVAAVPPTPAPTPIPAWAASFKDAIGCIEKPKAYVVKIMGEPELENGNASPYDDFGKYDYTNWIKYTYKKGDSSNCPQFPTLRFGIDNNKGGNEVHSLSYQFYYDGLTGQDCYGERHLAGEVWDAVSAKNKPSKIEFNKEHVEGCLRDPSACDTALDDKPLMDP